MKKLIDELKKLDVENEYEVPENFRQNVMKKVNNEEKIYNTKYVIATLSMAAIVVLGIFTASNNEKALRMNRMSIKTENEIYSSNDNIDSIAVNTASINSINKEYSFALEESIKSADTKLDYSDNAIIDMDIFIKLLENESIEVEKIEDYIKAKCSKEKASEILKEYDVTIEESGEYVIIK